jgi:hypothetical protein
MMIDTPSFARFLEGRPAAAFTFTFAHRGDERFRHFTPSLLHILLAKVRIIFGRIIARWIISRIAAISGRHAPIQNYRMPKAASRRIMTSLITSKCSVSLMASRRCDLLDIWHYTLAHDYIMGIFRRFSLVSMIIINL